ncbi:hypothetical protein SAMN02745133_00601 [Desulforamulus putei DSM 12395]|uniref:Uncharacterized protein n=1 Tax=Desulforamulus putei DSM 12395 TaxID=1121429 RepID=A0A1M4U6L3_9FIRM|nr:hypothetical protein [Desulforamulus putei]SHE52283.1 hypothetical protein SAMN02745133_00601 [Desulforamulus putei DSM 12395]
MSDKLKETQNPEAVSEQDATIASSGFLSRRGLLAEFEFQTLQPTNTSGATSIPLTTTPTTIACLTGDDALNILDVCSRVWLTATVGWQAINNADGEEKVDILFKIFRDAPVTGSLIFSCRQSADADEDDLATTTFTHVDLPLLPIDPCDKHCHKKVSYFLTAELPLAGSQANVIGPITFTGAQILPNPK